MPEKISYKAGGIAKLGRMIRSERNARRLTQKYVADSAFVSQAYLCRVEKGCVDSPPRPEFIRNVAEAIGVDPVPFLMEIGRQDCIELAKTIKKDRKERTES